MAKGSQLTQLKSALSQAGLSRQSHPSKKRKRSAPRENDNEKRAAKLKDIQEKLNPFEVKINRLKHDVGGRKLKGVKGRPQQSRQAGLEQRKKTLLKEVSERGRSGGIIDRRFGENDPTMTPEERMLERFTKERQRASKGIAYNLEDEDELTHYGQSLSKLDDFDNTELGLGPDDDDGSDDGKIDSETVRKVHFGGFDDDEENEEGEDGIPRKKSKADVMAEVMAKSKQHKYERQLQRQEDDITRHQLDEEFNDIRSLLLGEQGSSLRALEKLNKVDDLTYDRDVKELALDKRARPKDRTKTEEELALEMKEALEKAERKRLKRMMGEEDDSSDDEAERSKKKAKRVAGGDDLDDDFKLADEDNWEGLGAGLGDKSTTVEDEEEEEEEEEGDGSDSSEAEGDANSGSDENTDEEVLVESNSTRKARAKPKADAEGSTSRKVLPFTFSCPEDHDEFLSIVEDLADDDVPVVVKRIRALYHPSLAPENKARLQTLTTVLVDYILHVTSPPAPRFNLVSSLLPHLHSLALSYPNSTAQHFISKLKLMQKNLVRGLAQGATVPDSRTWPGSVELAILWTITHIFPTSDMHHHVVSPARLLMGAYLSLARVRSLRDLTSGLFLCTLFLLYEEFSKRLVPEVVSFLANVLLHIGLHPYDDPASVPGGFPCIDLNSESCRKLRLSRKRASHLEAKSPNLLELFSEGETNAEQHKVDLVSLALDLIAHFADMYKSLEGFIELFGPVLEIVESLELKSFASTLQAKIVNTKEILGRLLKFAHQSRRPLALQAHKPIPIASYIPKFETSRSSYLRVNDPDHERAEAAKLRYQYKQERKGAIRELRKDARFLSAVQQKEQVEKDRVYKERLNRVFSSLESERAEQKKIEKEKAKEKRRAGRK